MCGMRLLSSSANSSVLENALWSWTGLSYSRYDKKYIRTYVSTLPSQVVIIHLIIIASRAPMTTDKTISIVTISKRLVQ